MNKFAWIVVVLFIAASIYVVKTQTNTSKSVSVVVSTNPDNTTNSDNQYAGFGSVSQGLKDAWNQFLDFLTFRNK